MSVTTTADEKLQSAKDHLKEASIDILEILHPDTWGHSDYKEEFIATLEEVLIQLRQIRLKIS